MLTETLLSSNTASNIPTSKASHVMKLIIIYVLRPVSIHVLDLIYRDERAMSHCGYYPQFITIPTKPSLGLCSLFKINEDTGVIRTLRPLDYEQAPQHNITVVAHDSGPSPRTGRAFVIINVLDISDSVPLFEKTDYEAEVIENTIGPVITVKVSAI